MLQKEMRTFAFSHQKSSWNDSEFFVEENGVKFTISAMTKSVLLQDPRKKFASMVALRCESILLHSND